MNGLPPYGYRVTYERVYLGRSETIVMGVKGTYSHAVTAARIKPGCVNVLKTEPLTAEQYAKQFPPGRSRRGVKNSIAA